MQEFPRTKIVFPHVNEATYHPYIPPAEFRKEPSRFVLKFSLSRDLMHRAHVVHVSIRYIEHMLYMCPCCTCVHVVHVSMLYMCPLDTSVYQMCPLVERSPRLQCCGFESHLGQPIFPGAVVLFAFALP